MRLEFLTKFSDQILSACSIEFAQETFPPRGKTMYLRSLNCTPLERGDQTLKYGFYPIMLNPIV